MYLYRLTESLFHKSNVALLYNCANTAAGHLVDHNVPLVDPCKGRFARYAALPDWIQEAIAVLHTVEPTVRVPGVGTWYASCQADELAWFYELELPKGGITCAS